MYFYGIDSTYIIFVLPALLIAMWAQFNVNSTFNKFKTVNNRHGYTAHEVARKILDMNGLTYVKIERVAGHLSDHFDPRTNIVRLSDSTYSSTSVAAIGVAAHEVGHAVQHATGYAPIKIRNTMVPVANIGSVAGPYLIIIGLLLSGGMSDILLNLGVWFFSLAVLFQLVTLPVEFNASRRAIAALQDGMYLYEDEVPAVKKVLGAAAMTYVAAAAVSIANLLRFIMLINGRRRND